MLINYGALVLHDSRVAEKDTFLDLMEDYFNPSRPLHDLKKDQRLVQGLQATGSNIGDKRAMPTSQVPDLRQPSTFTPESPRFQLSQKQ